MLVWSRCGLGIVVCSGGIFEVEAEVDEGTMAGAPPPCVEALEELHAGDDTHVECKADRAVRPRRASSGDASGSRVERGRLRLDLGIIRECVRR